MYVNAKETTKTLPSPRPPAPRHSLPPSALPLEVANQSALHLKMIAKLLNHAMLMISIALIWHF